MMRKGLTAALLLLMLLAVACSKSTGTAPKGDPPASSVKEAPAGTVTLKVLDSFLPVSFDALIAGFYQEYPNVRIEKVPLKVEDLYTEGYVASLVKEHKVDIAIGNLFPPWESSKLLLDLEPYIQKSRLDLNALAVNPDGLRVEGRLYELPYTIEPVLILYNKAMFQEAGVPLPMVGWTWEQLRETAARVTRGSGDQKVWGFAPYSTSILGEYYRLQEAPREILLPDPAFKEMLQLFGTMIQTDQSMPPSVAPNDAAHIGDFRNGRAAMTLEQLGHIRDMPALGFAWGVLPLPTRAGVKDKLVGQARSLAIAANTPNPDAAWAFVRYVAGPAGAVTLAKAGYLPTNPTPEARTAMLERNPPLPADMVALLDLSWVPTPRDLDGSVFATVEEAYNQAIQDTLSGKVSWETAFDNYLRVAKAKR